MGPAPNSAEGSECKIRLIKKDTAGCDWASEPRHGLYNFYKKWVTWQDLFWEGTDSIGTKSRESNVGTR